MKVASSFNFAYLSLLTCLLHSSPSFARSILDDSVKLADLPRGSVFVAYRNEAPMKGRKTLGKLVCDLYPLGYRDKSQTSLKRWVVYEVLGNEFSIGVGKLLLRNDQSDPQRLEVQCGYIGQPVEEVTVGQLRAIFDGKIEIESPRRR